LMWARIGPLASPLPLAATPLFTSLQYHIVLFSGTLRSRYSKTPLYLLSAICIFNLHTSFFNVLFAIRTKISIYVLHLTYFISFCVLCLMYSAVSEETRQRSVLPSAFVNIGPSMSVPCHIFS
jgi:hypothetical protein